MPFFDSEFLAVILRAPVRPFLRHSLYHRWLERISPAAMSVPWQAYPNHEPCPIQVDEALQYQWGGDYFGRREERKLARRLAVKSLGRCLSPRFPSKLIDRFAFLIAIASCLLGSSRYSHVVRVGETFARYWQLTHPR